MKPSPDKLDPINTPVIIQDIVVVGKLPPPKPTGEFNNNSADEKTQSERIFNSIESLAKVATAIHKTNNFVDNSLKPNKENNITRVVTNEFLFYTKTPLTLKEFAELQEKIATLAALQPENIHLVLSSFAVKTPDGKIMNVVAHVECGKEPRLSFILKNNPSSIDPTYFEEQNGLRKILPNLDIEREGEISLAKVNQACLEGKLLINEKPIHFDFNNVIECETKGGVKFNTGVDICLDHSFSVAKKRKGDSPLQGSHIVTSNCIELKTENKIGIVTQADPLCSRIECKKGAKLLQEGSFDPKFDSTLNFLVTEPLACTKVCNETNILLECENILSNLNIKKNYKDAAPKAQKSFFTQYFKFQHLDRSNQIASLEKKFLTAAQPITELQKAINNRELNFDEFQEKLSKTIMKLDSVIRGVDAQIKLRGQNRNTSKMGKVLDDLNKKVENMKAASGIARKKLDM